MSPFMLALALFLATLGNGAAMPELIEPWKKCLYYLVRADDGGLPEEDRYFEHALAHIHRQRFENLPPLCEVELHGLIAAAERRGRLAELDEAVGSGPPPRCRCEGEP